MSERERERERMRLAVVGIGSDKMAISFHPESNPLCLHASSVHHNTLKTRHNTWKEASWREILLHQPVKPKHTQGNPHQHNESKDDNHNHNQFVGDAIGAMEGGGTNTTDASKQEPLLHADWTHLVSLLCDGEERSRGGLAFVEPIETEQAIREWRR